MDNITISVLCLTIATTLFILILYKTLHPTSTNHCPFPNPILGNIIPFIKNYHIFLDWITQLFNNSPTGTIEVNGPLGIMHGVATARPTVIEHLLRSNFSNYIKGKRVSSSLSDLFGDGIFVADGHLWALQRKTASREFTTRSLKSFIADVVEHQLRERLIPLLFAAADDNKIVDLQDVLRRFGFDNICTIAFGSDPCSLNYDLNASYRDDSEEYSFCRAFDEAVEISLARMFAPIPLVWKLKRFLDIGSEKSLRKAIQVIDAYAMKIIGQKEKQESKRQDLLSRFMAAMDDEVDNMFHYKEVDKKRSFLRDIIINFILAGKDSTSSALTWFFWILTVNPKCEQRIFEEISQHKTIVKDETRYDQLKELPYLHASLTESMRLYPPVPITGRMAVSDDVLPDGTRVKGGWFADYSAYAMARSEQVWGDDCRDYRPERWLDDKGNFVAVDPVKFPVFHAGPRSCLGREMAYVQMKAVAAAVIEKFKIEKVHVNDGMVSSSSPPPPYELMLTLRMKGGFCVTMKRRDG